MLTGDRKSDMDNLRRLKEMIFSLINLEPNIQDIGSKEKPQLQMVIEFIDKNEDYEKIKKVLQKLNLKLTETKLGNHLLIIIAEQNRHIFASATFQNGLISIYNEQNRDEYSLAVRTKRGQEIHGVAPLISYQHQLWKNVTLKVDWAKSFDTNWVFLDATMKAERLFFKVDSKLVSDLHERAIRECDGKSIPEILKTVNDIVNELTDVSGRSRDEIEKELDSNLEAFLQSQSRSKSGFVNLDFDTLAKEKLLVCRHKTILAASIIGTLVKKGILPPGTVRQYRSDLKDDVTGEILGAHAWCVYRNLETGKLWMCDPRWKTVINVTSDNISKIRHYGTDVLSEMLRRTLIEDEKLLQEYKNPSTQTLSSPTAPAFKKPTATTNPLESEKPRRPLRNPKLTKIKDFLENIPVEEGKQIVLIRTGEEIHIDYPYDSLYRAFHLSAMEQTFISFGIPYEIKSDMDSYFISIKPSEALDAVLRDSDKFIEVYQDKIRAIKESPVKAAESSSKATSEDSSQFKKPRGKR